MANKIRYQVEYNVQQSSLNQLKSSLQQIKKINISDVMKINNSDISSARDALRSVQQDASKVENALSKAFNAKLNTINIQTFNKELASSNLTIEKVHQSFSRVGTAGQSAFNSLSNQILNTNLKLRQSNKLLDSMAVSMANTVKWGITSSIFNNMTRSIQSAYYYAKDLDRSLTDIRIVTGDSADQMERFAQAANNTAKDLGRSTLDYTKTALSFYQQGLSSEQVQAKTQTTLKAENITGIGAEMSDYLTAVWNGFNVGAQDAELYVDKLAAVADSTASNMGQLATAISKVASAANNVGVDVDQLNGQIATVIATTRQAPQTVGVAFKTIYARINDIKAGTDQAEVSLGNYSGKMAELGFNVLDATGHLRDTGEVIEEIGGRWDSLTRQQQINLAQTMAGQRQYNNLIALFDNWDKYLQSVNTSLGAQGTLNQKNDRYLESLEAHMMELGTQAERTYDILFDTNTVKGFVDLLDGVLVKFNDFIKMFGSGAGALTNLGLVAANVFNKQITNGIDKAVNTFEKKLINIQNIKAIDNSLSQINQGLREESNTYTGQAQLDGERQSLQIKKRILQVSNSLTQSEYQELESLRNKIKEERTFVEIINNRQAIAEELLGIGDATDAQILARIQNEQKDLNIKKQQLVYIDNILQKTSQNIDGAQGVYQITEAEEQQLRQILGNKAELEQYEAVINKLVQGRVLTQEDIKLLTDEVTKKVGQQSEKMVTMKQLKQAVLAVQRGEFDSIQAALEADKQRTAEIQKQAQRRQLINNIVSKGTAIIQSMQTMIAGINQATSQTATGAEKANGYWQATTGALAGVANYLSPGAGLLVQGISSIIQSLIKGTDVYKSWEESLKSIEERINDLKEQQEQALKTSTTYTADKSQIENLSKEFDELSEKAGNYGQKLSTMTEEQQARYHELVEQIISKNPDLVAGYNSQGQAIIANNDAIKDTLNYLDQQYQKQMAILYAKQNVANAEKILKEKNQAATEAASNEYLTNPAKVVQERYNTKESYKKSSLDLVSSTKEVVAEYLADGLPISENQQTIFGQLSEVLNRLKNTQDDDIVQDFIVYVNDYKTKISKVGVTAQQIQQAQEIFYNDLLNLKNNKINNLSSSDFVSDATVKEIKDLFDNYILSVDQIQTQLNLAEQKISGVVAKANSENQTSNAELQAALISYKNYLFGALRYDPAYNTEFEIIRNEWKDNFTPQIESLLEGIMQDWVNAAVDTNLDQYIQEEDMTAAIIKDYNTFITDTFRKINPKDLTAASDEISKLMEKSGELSAKEFKDNFVDIFVKFVDSDSFQKIIDQDLAQHGNLDFSNMLLQSIFGEHVKITADEQGHITKIYENTFRRIINNVGKNSQDMSRKFLEEAGYSQEQLEALAAQIQKQGLYFDDWFRLQQYAKAFFKQTGDDFEQSASRLSEGFDKVNKAVEKVQAGKDLSYKDKLNLIQYLGLSPQQVEYADVILEKFKQQINSLEGLDRFEALSKVFTDFNTLKEHFQDFGIEEFGDEYNALWQNIFDSELEAIGMQQDQLKQWAVNRGIILEGAELKQSDWEQILGTKKMMQSAENLKTLANTFVDQNGKIKDDIDTTSEDFVKLQTTINELTGQNYDASTIKTMIAGIVEWTDNGSQSAQQYLEWLKQLFNYNPKQKELQPTERQQYANDQINFDNLQGASKSLTDRSKMSQDQIKALEQILSTNQELNRLAQTQGINSEIFLLKLNEILSTKQQQLEISRQQALLENQQEIKRTKAALEATDNFGKQLVTGQQRNKLQLKLNELTQQRLGLLQQIGKQEQQHTLDADIKQDEYQNLTNYVRATADANEDFADSLEQDVEGAEQVSEALLRYKAALQDVSKNYDDWIKKLNSGDTVQQAEAVSDLANAYGDLLDLPSDVFSDEFIKDADNLQLLQDAVNGVDGAYEELMAKAQQDILTQVGIDASDFESGYYDIKAKIDNGIDNIEVGAFIENSQAIQAMNQLINMADMTAAEAQALLGSMGVEAEVEQAKIPKSGKDQFVNADAQVSYEEVDSPIVVPFLGALGSTKVRVPSITYSGDKTVVPKEGEETVTALRVKTARKSSGGGIKRRNIPAPSSSGNKGGKSGGGKGGKGKGGGGGKGAQPDKSKKDPKKLLEDQRDIYHDINIQLDQINRTLERVQKQQDRLYGKTLLDNLTKQQDLLDKHKDTLNSKLQLQKQDLAHQKEALKNLGVTFDQYGNISNYMSILGQKQVQINNLIREENALIAAYNKETNKEAKQAIADQITQKEKQTKSAQDDFKSLQDKIKNYDKLLNDDMQDVIDQIEEQTQKQIELEIQKFRMEVQIRLDMGQAERDWNKFINNVLNRPDLMKGSEFDNILGNAGQSFNDLFSYFDVHGSKGTIETLTDQLLQTKKQIEDIDEKGKSAIYGDNKAEAMKHLQDDLKELMDQMEDIEQLIEDIDNAYLDTIEDISDQFDKQIEDYEYVNDLIQHSMDLLTLLYGDKNFDAMNNYYTTLRDNNLKQIDSLKQQRDFWKEQWEAAFAAGDLKAAEKFEEKYKNTINNLNSLIQKSAKLLQEKYANAIEGIFDALDNKLSSGKGIDYINTSWDLMNQNNDEYLDTINTAFAIQQTERKYKDALDNTKSIKNQQALNKLMNQQLDILRNKAKVTEYDVERAEKLLQVEQARIALEESQSAKTSMRLKRDSQGNYSYQYVADQNAIDQARENLANAQNELYNFDKDRYKANLDDMIAAWKDFRDQYKDIILDASLEPERRMEKLALLEQKWGEYINDKTAENAVIRNNLMDSAFTELASMYQTDVANYMQMAEDEKNILMEDLVPAWGSGIQQMTDKFAGEGGFIPTCEQAFDSIIDTTQDYKDQLDDLAETAQIDLNDVANGVNNLSNQFQDLIMDNNELINTMTIEMTSIASLRAEAQLLAAEYQVVYQAAKQATTAIHNFIQAQQQAAAGAQSTNSSSSGSRSNSSYSGSGSSSSSGGGSGSSSSGTKSGSSGSGGGGSGSGSSGSGGSNSGSFGGGSSTSSSSSGSSRGIYVDSNWMQRKKKNYTGSNRTSSYSTGGYTGDWGSDEGKLAILHEKELVLNQKDTKNFLQGINILRQISDNLNGNVYSMLGGLVSGRNSNNALNGDSIEQDVHIDANFPNVNSKKEIEEALSDLVNLAAQRVMRRS